MKSILLIAFANIRRRKLQSFLVGISLALAVLLFSTTLALLFSMQEPFDQMFQKLRASHLLLFFDHRQEDPQKLANWFAEQPEVVAVSQAVPSHTMEEALIFRDEEIDLTVRLTEHHDLHNEQDRLLILKGEAKAHPGPGEIWIPNHLATNHGIQVGDSIGVPMGGGLFPLSVSALVVDPHFASGLFNPTRAWVAPGGLSFLLPPSQLTDLMMGVRMQSPEAVAPVWNRFQQEYGFGGNSLEYGLFKSVFLSFYQIISLVLLVFSVLAMLASIFILFITLNGAITADTRLIGIYKTQGFTPQNAMAIYLWQYLLLTAISLPIGLLGSAWVTSAILSSLMKSLGLVNLNGSIMLPFAITAVFFFLLVALLSFLAGRKAGRIKPAIAIRSDPVVGSYAFRPFSRWLIHSSVGVPFFIGLRMLFANPKRAAYTAFSLFFAIFLLVFSLNVSHSFARLKENKAAWGLEDADLQVRLNKKIALPLEHRDFIELIQAEPEVKAVIPYSYCRATIPATAEQASRDLVGRAYSGNIDDIGLGNLTGRHPEGDREIGLCVLTAAQLRKQPGDTLDLFIEGQQQSFVVTSIYQDVSNLGQGFRLTGNAMKTLNPLSEPELYALQLHTGVEVSSFRDRLQQTFAETVLLELSVEDRQEIRNTIANMRRTLLLVSVFFLSILLAILFNDALMNIHEFKHSFGVLKTVGMTPVQIRMALVGKIFALTAVCLFVTLPIALWLSPVLISQITQGIGLQEFPFLYDLPGTILLIPGMLLFTSLTVWWASRRVLGIATRELFTA